MNPEFNNRTYYALEPDTFKKILVDLAVEGNNVLGTKEFANTRIVIPELPSNYSTYFGDAGANLSEVLMALQAVAEKDNNFVSEIYDSRYYTFLNEAGEQARRQFITDCTQTRRAVITFPATHCFETIQLLVRGGILIVTVNMRSCNAYKNLVSDLYLALLVALPCVGHLRDKFNSISMIANIGSLHLFTEDVKNVL